MILRHVQQPHEVGVNAVGHWETCCEIPNKPQTKSKNQDNATARGSPLRDLPEWLQDFTDNLVDAAASVSSGAPASISREPLHQKPSRKGYRASTLFFLTSRRTEVEQYARGQKIQGLLAENALAIKYLQQKSFLT